MRSHGSRFCLVRFSISVLTTILILLPVVVSAAPQLPPLNATPTGKQLTGKFIWFDLATDELNNQQTFYGDVFGWQFRRLANTDDQYTLIQNGNQNIAGMFHVDPGTNAERSALWIGLMSAPNPQQLASVVEKNGGVVHMPPTTVAQRGTFALFRDPEGALFGLLKSDSGDQPDETVPIGSFFWVDLFAKDQRKAGDFYKTLVNYDISEGDVGNGSTRLVLNSHERPRAGIVPLPEDVSRAGWLPYVRVADVNETLAKAIDNGGRVLVAPQKELLDGNLAIFADPKGGVMGIVKWDDSTAGAE